MIAVLKGLLCSLRPVPSCCKHHDEVRQLRLENTVLRFELDKANARRRE